MDCWRFLKDIFYCLLRIEVILLGRFHAEILLSLCTNSQSVCVNLAVVSCYGYGGKLDICVWCYQYLYCVCWHRWIQTLTGPLSSKFTACLVTTLCSGLSGSTLRLSRYWPISRSHRSRNAHMINVKVQPWPIVQSDFFAPVLHLKIFHWLYCRQLTINTVVSTIAVFRLVFNLMCQITSNFQSAVFRLFTNLITNSNRDTGATQDLNPWESSIRENVNDVIICHSPARLSLRRVTRRDGRVKGRSLSRGRTSGKERLPRTVQGAARERTVREEIRTGRSKDWVQSFTSPTPSLW